MAKLDGKVALITGAAAGLGEGISTAYAKYGAKLIMVDLSPEVEKTAEKLRKEYNAEIITQCCMLQRRCVPSGSF